MNRTMELSTKYLIPLSNKNIDFKKQFTTPYKDIIHSVLKNKL